MADKQSKILEDLKSTSESLVILRNRMVPAEKRWEVSKSSGTQIPYTGSSKQHSWMSNLKR